MTSRKGSSIPHSSPLTSSIWGQCVVAPTTTTDDDYTDTCSDVSTDAIKEHGRGSCNNGASTLPDEVANVLTLCHPVLAWTRLDPRIGKNKIRRYMCLRLFDIFLFNPFTWPGVIITMPFSLGCTVGVSNRADNAYYILTTHELIEAVMDNDGCCCIAGCHPIGVHINTIPLESIIDVGIEYRNGIFTRNCIEDMPIFYVDTPARNGRHGNEHAAEGIGLENYDSFMQQVLRARDAIRHPHSTSIHHYNNGFAGVGTVELPSLCHHQSSPMIMNRHDDRDSTVVPVIAERDMESSATTVAVGITTTI